MRSRGLFRESPSTVCAFCAHQVRQSRRPAHIQRRFLQSSRPASKPPSEASCLQEEGNDADTRSSPSTWGRPAAARGSRLGPTPSWGRPVGKGGVPPPSSWGRPHPEPNGISSASTPVAHGNQTATTPNLLPHEQRARELMLENTNKAQQRPVMIPRGPGPESNRAGRPVVMQRTPEVELEIARRSSRREEARAMQLLRQQRQQEASNGAPPNIRKVDTDTPFWPASRDTRSGGEVRPQGGFSKRNAGPIIQRVGILNSPEPPSQTASGGTRSLTKERPQWGQLRRKAEVDPQEPVQSGEKSFDKSRAQREEQAKTARYTPIFKPSSREQQPSDESRNDDSFRISRDNISRQSFSTPEPKEPVQRDTNASMDRLKKSSARFSSEPSPGYSNVAKGKDRDKAKRRQQFAYDIEEEEAAREEARKRTELKKQRKREKAARKPVPIMLPEFISVSNLAIALRVRQEDFIEKMTELGFEETNHDFIMNAENAGLIAMEYNYEPIIDRGESENLTARAPAPDPSILPQRPPVVTIMGHVDHGKTTILDYLRKSSVAATEHGGITQHIGAFSVPMPSGKTITFLDTPGHAAFLSMRQRGANVTDIVILVVAADDSVKPQTIEAINHAKTAKVPIIVAINKVDKEEANIERVKQDLSRHGVDVEDFGGDTQVVCVSGKTGQGMGELEEAAVALSDILDMRAEKDGEAEGTVIEASIKSMGKVATVLVRRGTMRPGDFIVAGQTWARIRCLRNEAGIDIEEAGPGTPVEIDGWREQPVAGDEVLQAPDEAKAKSVVDYRLEREERERMAGDMEAINESRKAEQDKREQERLEARAKKEGVVLEMPEQEVGGPKQVYFILKGDVSGSVEAVIDSIAQLGNKEVQPHILRSGVGQLSEFDIDHAAVAKGHLINFNTEVDPHILKAAEQAKVNILDHNIIYRLVDDVKAELSKHLPPLITQRVLGEADIAEVFSITVKGRKLKNVAGCKVRNGTIGKNAKVRVMRNGEKVFDGNLASLKNVKKDVTEMKKGSECGMGFDGWFDFQVGDQIQAYEQNEEKRYL
ncbi:Uncharacterized protein BP5553_09038 [Venustampulla echinocandica]|uniref:Translation initiation factor IF-2, mitochondrial n=1 Tax=Venustampulla echinocandica TaxID=2656787 RepID=A0A370TDQ7_9HELO|nr:Uncharacterized protein BP5553_09038 [Venustampulla echinocandica]RDL32582.1 Uncharacterized protein BP5553_09038 [Venustampulla echinocandica]